ncbi:MAG: DUF262 domain-containing HNH endonuclease family protein [Oscillospiraceae bacterium]|nr:DUF262 domain-containing HNH endonuclease family protein [Oscillospiraceae bacterium]
MKVTSESIHAVLSQNNSSFYIPPFQRAYSWGKPEQNRYFDDIRRIIESERNPEERDKLEHFFGVLVIKPEGGVFAQRHIVVDGQQRLTTSLLLLIALRDWIQGTENNLKLQIDNTYLKNQSSSYDEKIKLKQVTADWDAYCALVNGTQKIAGKITDGYVWFSALLKKSDFTADELFAALNRINVACISLDERAYKGEDPQIIFETLNSLGKPLSFADLIRNYILLGVDSKQQTEIFDNKWHPKIESQLVDKTSHFFRDFMQYKDSTDFKVISDNNTKELYAQFKTFVKKHYDGDRVKFVNDVCRYVPLYLMIDKVEFTENVSSNLRNNKITVLLRNIFHTISAEAFKPFVLGLLAYHEFGFNGKKLSDEQLIDALEVICTYLIRRRILKVTQGETKAIPALCRELENRWEQLLVEAKTVVFALLYTGIHRVRLPNDTEIANELVRIDFYNGLKKYRKFILGKVEENRAKVSVNMQNEKVTVEHIMPQTINKSNAWQKELGQGWQEVHLKYVHNIGNLILTEFNSEMGNKSISEKRKLLEKSNLQYRFDVLNKDTWNEEDMLNHQNDMIERILTTFPLPQKMRHTDNWDTNVIDTTPDIFSPLEEDVNITGIKPKKILIKDEEFEVNNWSSTYLIFLSWLQENNSSVFEMLLKQAVKANRPDLITRQNLKLRIEEFVQTNANIDIEYKRLQDGKAFRDTPTDESDNVIYVKAHRSAKSLISKIADAMELVEMNKDSVMIETQ